LNQRDTTTIEYDTSNLNILYFIKPESVIMIGLAAKDSNFFGSPHCERVDIRYGKLRIHEVLPRIKLQCCVSAEGCMVGSELLQGEAGFSLGSTRTGTV
jgi:hypothetical protein